MADQARLGELAEQLNALLGDVTPYRLAVVAPGAILPVDKNAHYMSKRVYDQLVANVRKDGNLSSLPFCWQREDGQLVVLSGNHRVMAAQDAGIPLVLVLYTDARLTTAQQRAIQLSHNALVGQDNPTTLRELWQEIADLEMKVYSGLDDKLLETMGAVQVARINEAPLRFEELTILFLTPEVERIKDMLARLGAATKPRLAARCEDFDRFFEMLLQFKEAAGIVNTGTAVLAMMDIVEAWIAEHNAAERSSGEQQ